MAKMIIFVPTETMQAQAENVVRAMNVDGLVLRETSATVVATARREQENGAVVAVARGNQANMLLRGSSIPVIEIVMSGQNLAMLFAQARELSGKEHPKLALVGFPNMFGDVSTLAKVMNLEVETFFSSESRDITALVERAWDAQADVVIGGEIAIAHAARLGMTHLFLQSTQDSIETAVRLAKRVLYAIELEKRRSAEIASLLDYSFDGVLRLDSDGNVLYANYLAERIFRMEGKALQGKNIEDLLWLEENDHPLKAAMRQRKNVFGCVVRIRRRGAMNAPAAEGKGGSGSQVLMSNLAAVNVDSENMGFILSVQESRKIEELEEQIRRERSARTDVARGRFEDFHTKSPSLIEVRDTAVKYARYDHPVLIVGENGVGKRMLAECIHNSSMRSDRPFVAVDCGGFSETAQQALLMGDGESWGAFRAAHTGTLLIENVDRMAESCQYQLFHAIAHGSIVTSNGRVKLPVNVRVICTTTQSLYRKVQEGTFLAALYSRLSQLELNMPPLSQRSEDLPELLDVYIEKYSMIYRKYVSLSPEAKKLIYSWTWVGHLRQFELFCEKLVMIADDKVITEGFVMKHLPKPYGVKIPGESGDNRPILVVSDTEGADILSALKRHQGNRLAAAADLGISKTTLWRKMKKYGIDKSYK